MKNCGTLPGGEQGRAETKVFQTSLQRFNCHFKLSFSATCFVAVILIFINSFSESCFKCPLTMMDKGF